VTPPDERGAACYARLTAANRSRCAA